MKLTKRAVTVMSPLAIITVLSWTSRPCRAWTMFRPVVGRGSSSSTLSTRYAVWSLSTLSASATTSTSTSNDASGGGAVVPPMVPVTILSGFLGSGKTTALEKLLENTEGLKVGIIVNDMANVNVDARLVKSRRSTIEGGGASSSREVVELQNGCACCSLADELMTSAATLLFGSAVSVGADSDRPTTRDFDALVVELSGVSDPSSVRDNWKQAKAMGHPVTQVADLRKVVTLVDATTFGTDWMTWDVAGEREGWTEEGDDCSARRQVPELLAEQIEAADVLLVNKCDLAGSERVKMASALAKGLNKDATLHEVSFGSVSPSELLGETVKDLDHDHGHDHSHGHSHDSVAACTDPDCTDPTHDHDHDHSHSHSHDHGHAHDHAHDNANHVEAMGINSFVYRSDRPFDTRRLMSVLNSWPIPHLDDLEGLEDLLLARHTEGPRSAFDTTSPFARVLRSKGFAWLAPTSWRKDPWRHDTAMYWSHAGKHFGINTAGKWWGSLPRDVMERYFHNDDDGTFGKKELERILNEDWASEEFGDRRQEIVFIGAGVQEAEAALTRELDACLLTEEELDTYRKELRQHEEMTIDQNGKNPMDWAEFTE